MRRSLGLLAALGLSVGCQLVLGIEDRSGRVHPEGDADLAGGDDAPLDTDDGDRPRADASVDAPGVDAGPDTDASADADAGFVWPGCDPLAPFESVVAVTEINTAQSETSARLSPDQLTLYFSRAPSNLDYGDLYVATRGKATDPFSNVTLLDPPTTTGIKGDHDPVVSADGLTLWFDSYVLGPRKLFVSTRADAGAPWSAGTNVDMGTGYEEYEPSLTGDMGVMYFTAPKPAPGDPGNSNVFRAFFDGGAVARVDYATDVDSVKGERSAVVSADDRVLYFSTNRNTTVSGDYDVWVATRTDPTKPFGLATRVDEVSSASYYDAPTWVSADLCTLYFVSMRADSQGYRDVYVATRTKKK